MPELPDITAYLEALKRKVQGSVIEGIEIRSPFLLRSVDPGLEEARGKNVLSFRRLGKQIVWQIENDIFYLSSHDCRAFPLEKSRGPAEKQI